MEKQRGTRPCASTHHPILTILSAVLLVLAASAAQADVPKPDHKPAVPASFQAPAPEIDYDNATLPVPDTEESYDLPAYPAGARVSMGTLQTYKFGEEDTMLDVARHFNLGFVELRAANLSVDPWAPLPGSEIVIPNFRLLPRAPQEGIVVNLAEMRMYYFRKPGQEPETYPIGIGRDGLATPEGETKVERKVAGPSWFPTDRMRVEKPWLPKEIKAGASNPLGTHALYLGWPTFLIHGSNKPWAIGTARELGLHAHVS